MNNEKLYMKALREKYCTGTDTVYLYLQFDGTYGGYGTSVLRNPEFMATRKIFLEKIRRERKELEDAVKKCEKITVNVNGVVHYEYMQPDGKRSPKYTGSMREKSERDLREHERRYPSLPIE